MKAGGARHQTEEGVGVAHGAVRHQATDSTLLQPQELDIATDRLPRTHRGHDQHLTIYHTLQLATAATGG